MKETKLSDLMPDYKFDMQELSQIKGGGPDDGPSDKPVENKPPTVCNTNLCQDNRDAHLGECSAASCLTRA